MFTKNTGHRIRLDDCAAKHCKDGSHHLSLSKLRGTSRVFDTSWSNAVSFCCDQDDDDSDGEDGGPYIRRLSEKQSLPQKDTVLETVLYTCILHSEQGC